MRVTLFLVLLLILISKDIFINIFAEMPIQMQRKSISWELLRQLKVQLPKKSRIQRTTKTRVSCNPPSSPRNCALTFLPQKLMTASINERFLHLTIFELSPPCARKVSQGILEQGCEQRELQAQSYLQVLARDSLCFIAHRLQFSQLLLLTSFFYIS